MPSAATSRVILFLETLEKEWRDRSDNTEEQHLQAAMDAQLLGPHTHTGEPVFDDIDNADAVLNCLSPYVPSSAAKIAEFYELVRLQPTDTVLDIGCGDGRVCIGAAKLYGCQAVGVDVSPVCIRAATAMAAAENLSARQCAFVQCDATLEPEYLVNGPDSPLRAWLESVTVVFLYTYPTLLESLIPLLARLTRDGTVKVVTLTYHLPDPVHERNEAHELQLYAAIHECK